MKQPMKTNSAHGTTTRITNQTNTNLSQKKSLISINSLLTGAIALVMWCIVPIIPILLAFCAGHFVSSNGDKQRRKGEHNERPNSRRY